MKYSIVIPVYKNRDSIPRLLEVLEQLRVDLENNLEVVFVVDGSPDESHSILFAAINQLNFPAQLIAHSRNFGSFAAIRTGLIQARGEFFGVMAADLQEPPELLTAFFKSLELNECDVAIGTRSGRKDAWTSKVASNLFWSIYKKFVVPEMPKGGVDVFGCNKLFRNQLINLEESRSSLIALIFWLGFRRKFISYERLERTEGVSSWTLSKKIDYMMDSVFAFTDYPIRFLIKIGTFGCLVSIIVSAAVLIGHLSGQIKVPGYAPTILVSLFFGALNILCIGLVGVYSWRGYENTKNRPLAITSLIHQNDKYPKQ